jgi:hypothetical protein
MTALTSLNELADGTEVILRMPNSRHMQRWTVGENKLVRDGVALDPWFFAGYVADGQMFLSDNAPPEVGDWFGNGTRWKYLVLSIDGTSCRCAIFREGEFSQFSARDDLGDGLYTRGRPNWSPEQTERALLQMAIKADELNDELGKVRVLVQNQSRVREYLRYVKDYAERAERLVTT